MVSMKIKIPSLPENLRVVESFIDNIKEEYCLTDDIYGNIMITVIEAVNNAIIHGNKKDKNKDVKVGLSHGGGFISFVIEDEGNGFDHLLLPDPTIQKNLSKPGGRGVFLMKNLCDEVSFQKNGSHIELKFYLL